MRNYSLAKLGLFRNRDDFAWADHRGRSTGCACARALAEEWARLYSAKRILNLG